MPQPALVMPMAGRGSRFARNGVQEPKPLVQLAGRPFFWWAAQSVLQQVRTSQLVFVVLEEHVDQFAIDREIGIYYPDAHIVAIPDITSGAAETAQLGVNRVVGGGPVIVNDCDHAFVCSDLAGVVQQLAAGAGGALTCFQSKSGAYSYVQLDEAGAVVGTFEKQVVSRFAIAGCYLFASAMQFLALFEDYQTTCPYDELFVSGMYNLLLKQGVRVLMVEAERHLSFGTPEELSQISPEQLESIAAWL
jgi:CTP:molybdopterin cytidylyltransferase MocA